MISPAVLIGVFFPASFIIFTSTSGIGGDAPKIWACDRSLDEIYELSTIDLTVVRLDSSPGSKPYGIGGDADTIWQCDDITPKIYELDTELSVTILSKTAHMAAKMLAEGVI